MQRLRVAVAEAARGAPVVGLRRMPSAAPSAGGVGVRRAGELAGAMPLGAVEAAAGGSVSRVGVMWGARVAGGWRRAGVPLVGFGGRTPARSDVGTVGLARRTVFGQAFEVGELNATRRTTDDTGSRKARKARSEGKIPGVIYGNGSRGFDNPILVYTDEHAVQTAAAHFGRSLENTLFNLDVEGKVMQVLPRQLQRHPSTFAVPGLIPVSPLKETLR